MKFKMIKGKVQFTKDFPAERKEELIANGWICEEGSKPKKKKAVNKKKK